MTKVSVDARIHLAERRSAMYTWYKYFPGGVHDERAPVDVTKIHTIRRNRQPL